MAKILIVDDEEIARLTLAQILRIEGYETVTVGSGEAAVERLSVETFDVMILDLKMPGMNGIEVLKSVVETLPNLAIIIMTAYGTMDSAIQAIHYRVHDYLLKPVKPEDVLASIADALKKPEKSIAEPSVAYHVTRGMVDLLPGGATLAWDKRQIAWTGGSLSLTPTEARLLKILFERKNEMVTHSELVFLIQGYQIDTEDAAKILRPVVSRLRQKLISVPAWDDRIKNVRGAGYVLELD